MGVSTLVGESWRPIAEGYEVSDQGRVRSYRNRQGHPQSQPRLLSQIKRGGYCYVKLTRARDVQVHQLVLEAFVGLCPEGMECRHLDGQRSNNRLENLCWGSKPENYADRRSHGTDNAGERHWHAKLTEQLVRMIRVSTQSPKQIAIELGVSLSAVQHVRYGRSWKHVQ